MAKWIIALALLFFGGQCLSLSEEGDQGIVTTMLTANLAATETVAHVTGTSGFPKAGRIYIDSEEIPYSDKTSTTFTGLQRAVNAEAHNVDTIVYSEVAGIMNVGLDFEDIQSTAPIIGPVATVANGAKWFGGFLFKAVIWDYSFFNGVILGFPLVYLKYFMYCISIALVFVVALAARQFLGR